MTLVPLLGTLQQLHRHVRAAGVARSRSRSRQSLTGDLLDVGDPSRRIGDTRNAVSGDVGVHMAGDVARPESDQPDERPDRQRYENHNQDAERALMATQFVGIDQKLCASI